MMNTLASLNKTIIRVGMTAMLLMLFVTAIVTAADKDTDPLVIINHDTITVGDLNDVIISKHRTLSDDNKESFQYENLLKKLVNDALIIQEAIGMGMAEEAWLLEKLDGMLAENARNKYIRDNFTPDLTVPEEDINKFFFDYYFKMKLRTISSETIEEAREVKKQLLGGAPMDSLAEAVSIDSKKHNGGSHRLKFYADIENELRLPAETLKVGELSNPVPFRKAYVVIKLEDYIEPDTAQLPILYPRIERMLREKLQKRLWGEFVDSLLSIHDIKTDETVMGAIKADADNLFTEQFSAGTDSPAMTIDGNVIIRDTDIRKSIAHYAMNARDLSFDSLLSAGVDRIMGKQIMDLEARNQGLYEDPALVAMYNNSFDSALIEIYVGEVVVNHIRFNRPEFEDYYNSHLDEFRDQPKFQMEHLIVSTEDSMKQIHKRLKDGAAFDFISKQVDPNNTSESTPNKWQSLDGFPHNVQHELEVISVGGFSKPYHISTGWIIFYIKNKKLGRQKTMEEVDMKLREILFQEKFNAMLDENINLLKENSEITYFQKRIDRFFNK